MKQEAKIIYLLECLQKTAPPVLIFAENKVDVDIIHEYLLCKVGRPCRHRKTSQRCRHPQTFQCSMRCDGFMSCRVWRPLPSMATKDRRSALSPSMHSRCHPSPPLMHAAR